MAISLTLAPVKMKDGSTKLQLKTPYAPDLPARCKALGGKWGPADKAWYFDERDAGRVRDLCVETFGIDPLAEPDEAPELVTVRVSLDAFSDGAEAWAFGRELARRPGRDYDVRLGGGVILISGGFPRTGGSMKNPSLAAKDGTVLEVRDVPRPLAEQEVANWRPMADGADAATRKAEALVAELEARLAAGPTDQDRAAQFFTTGEPLTPEAAGERVMSQVRQNLQDAQGRLESSRRYARAMHGAVRIVDEAPRAVEAVDPATVQIGALFASLQPPAQRRVIVSMIGNLSSAERASLLRELGLYVEQGAL